MRTESYNLVDEPWIPVTLAPDFPGAAERGPAPRVSLREAFEFGDRILDLRCYPHERIALTRLLICIAQRALDGPADEDEWRNCLQHITPKALAYLNQCHDCFNLLGDGPRFLQGKGSGTPKSFSPHKLKFIDEDGPTLFDAHVGPKVSLPLEDIAVSLVTFQSFAAGGRVEGSKESLTVAPCREGSAIHAFVTGSSLLETIWCNLIPISYLMREGGLKDGATLLGMPSWEGTTASSYKAYLYRLAPVCRKIWLKDDASVDGYGGIRLPSFAQHGIRELTASVRRSTGKEEVVSASGRGGVVKAIWRELHSIAVLRAGDKRGGPAAFEHLHGANGRNLRVCCGAMVSKQSKVIDIIEASFQIPMTFIETADVAEEPDPKRKPGANQIYRNGVELAEEWAARLRNAVQKYRLQLADDDKGVSMQNQAATRYWTALEQKAESVLLHRIAVAQEGYDGGDVAEWLRRSLWGREVMKAARNAYDFSCPHATPKQLRAYAEGLKALFGKGKKADSDDEAGNDDSGEEVSDEN